MGFSAIPIKDASRSDLVEAQERARQAGYQKALRRFADERVPVVHRLWRWLNRAGPDNPLAGKFTRLTTFAVRINQAEHLQGEWFARHALRVDNRLWLPGVAAPIVNSGLAIISRLSFPELWLTPAPNLAVNTGLHIAAQRSFGLTAVASSTDAAVDTGGVDNSSTAVSATTTRFDTTGANRFLRAFDSTPTYSTTNKRITALYTITNSDTPIIHRRYGLSNDGSDGVRDNDDFTLFTMLSGFELNFNGKAYDVTVQSQTDYTGS